MKKTHKYDMGVIGNCAFMAYIDTKASVRWLCWPRFDSSFIFGDLLDDEKGGEFSVKPTAKIKETKQYYVTNTNILVTEVYTEEGDFKVTDFAPRFEQDDRYYKPLMMIRKIEPLQGTPSIKVVCNPTGEYGEFTPEKSQGSNHIRYLGYDQHMRLTTNIPLSYVMEENPFVLSGAVYTVLTYGAPLEAAIEATSEAFFTKTKRYWRNWVKSTSISFFHQEKLIRSSLILKIHQYEDTGAIIASGTTSLPEYHKSTRNWDYRYCWMRDSFYTLNAFNNIGHFEEVEAYFKYIENVTRQEEDRYQPLYTITAQKQITEIEMPLKGYLGENKPVRIGNDAYTHIQNDVYGQVLTSLLPLYADKRFTNKYRMHTKKLVEHTLQKIADTMEEKDAGLWEFRDRPGHYCYTFLFHWAGASAAYKMAQYFDDVKMADKALKIKERAAEMIERCYDEETGVYMQAAGAKDMDASCLQLITMNYLDPNSERARRHLAGMEKELMAKDGLFYRYRHVDDFGAPETTFLICAYWYIEALACVGRVKEAIEYFEKVSSYANHVGLLSEDVDSNDGSQWGNFPQTYSHVGLMNAAYRISKKLDLPNFL
ncbi:glycoside hydrolase family 15 protein [Flammeovirga yaeyamensis]|uniref:Glycoside hydrolase family 15 protein n=1 Tax=Flammeovirga yaeyamensis TaxID=367791 RepID=A0AAX1N3L0_9BACT|nr:MULTISPECIES: glycoside hydrolase family 15 protein [Flammeovirga]ANQ50462.1 glycoside hydrolase family 15 protein [Flammeovirga sp. MY04]MBB3700696.1 GH15 family glucan-1,4-alpha-glucosidase [Flammeovirga yaeyamensis]NMF37808.1 glycoside hydrolase family 15 protein [Flammeovirga yaeyamensis]QWG02114.1 glycoside hydrolase family 15 protein [Flammeovirga yaeyamensis]